jgi:hypothetical protein
MILSKEPEIVEIEGDVEICRIGDDLIIKRKSEKILKVKEALPMEGHRLWVRFTTGEAQIFDFKPLLNTPAFAPLADQSVFNSVYIDHGIPVWKNGDIDIAPEKLYECGVPDLK